jgi:DNA-binding NarL/FixJ family response regulator
LKILLIDDHALFRDGLLLVLEDLKIDIETFEACSFESASEVMQAQPDLDMVLLDLGLPGTSYLDALLAIRQRLPKTLIVIVSGTEDQQMVEQALHNGARGYIPKSSPANIILHALQLVISGGTYVPAQILHRKDTLANININKLPGHNLTPRQYDVLLQLATGKSNKEIGKQLNLTESTVRAHVAAILKACNVANRTHAVQFSQQNGWL